MQNTINQSKVFKPYLTMFNMKNIQLHLDEKMFYKMKKHKADIEAKYGIAMTWEHYTKYLFGLR